VLVFRSSDAPDSHVTYRSGMYVSQTLDLNEEC
jgi:hypothetical protein